MIDSKALDAWEESANTNITRADMAESVTLTSLAWCETNDKILGLIQEIRKLQEREAAFRDALTFYSTHSSLFTRSEVRELKGPYFVVEHEAVSQPFGTRAREVLARYPEEKEEK